MVDPIGITNISSISVISPPLVSSLISIPPTPSSSYRIPRTFVGKICYCSTKCYHQKRQKLFSCSALEDSLFTLVLIDSQSGALHWMIIDIPQSILAIDVRMGGVEVRRLTLLLLIFNFILACFICNSCRRKDRIMFIILLHSSSTIHFSSFYSSVL